MKYRPADDEGFRQDTDALSADYLGTNVRPRERRVVGRGTLGVQVRPTEVAEGYERVRGSDFLVARIEPFVAFGGDLPFDVVFVVGFDGVQSPLLDVRFSVRPDRMEAVTATRIRVIPLDALVQEAVMEHRAVFREVSPGELHAVSDSARHNVYVEAMAASRFASRRRISDDDLRRVAEVYRLAVARRQPPTSAVREELRLSNRNVARKWVQRARQEGFLEPAPGERRGGLIR